MMCNKGKGVSCSHAIGLVVTPNTLETGNLEGMYFNGDL